MLRWHSSHNVLKNLLHDFDEPGIELGHGSKLSIWPSTTIGTAILKRTFSRSSAAVDSIIRDCAQALNGQENVSITRCIAGCLRFLALTQCRERPVAVLRDQSLQPHQWRNRSGPISPCSKSLRKIPSTRRASSRQRLALRIDCGGCG